MTTRKHREQCRINARNLVSGAHTCSECGEKGFHWIGVPQSLFNVMINLPPEGFWTCAKFYGADGRRINA
jgi:hypothetical protein